MFFYRVLIYLLSKFALTIQNKGNITEKRLIKVVVNTLKYIFKTAVTAYPFKT